MIQKAGIFGSNDFKEWKLDASNYNQILRVLNMNVSQFSLSIRSEIKKRESITYEEFCTLFKREFAKAASVKIQMKDDSDLLKTPAQKIISMLREI